MISLLLLLSPGVLDVDPVRGPYVEIRDAVADASPGDVIRVAEGSYQGFGIFGMELTVAARRAQDSVQVAGTVRVQGLEGVQSVLLDGLEIQALPGSGDAALIVADCAGSIRVQDSSFGSLDSFGVRVERSSDVVLSDCSATSESAATLNCLESSLTIFGGRYIGLSGLEIGQWGLDALHCASSQVFLQGSTVSGGFGGEEDGGGFGCNVPAGQGGNAVVAQDSEVRILGGSVTPGVAGFSFWCPGSANGQRVVLGGTSTLTDYGGEAIDLDVKHALRMEGANVNVVATGTPGTPIVLAVGTAAGRVDLPGFTGDLYVGGNLSTVRRVFAGTSPAQLQLTLPQLPPQGIAQFHFQAVELRSTEVVFGESRFIMVLDSAW